ncbi:MAG: OadG family protein [Clostridia bacterium]
MNVLAVIWYSVKVMLLGMGIVFVGLFILIAVIMLISYLIRKAQDKLVAKPVAVPAAEQALTAPVEEIEMVSGESDPELIAVIMSAIMACEGSGKKLVVRSVRRLGGNAWGGAGRREQLGI